MLSSYRLRCGLHVDMLCFEQYSKRFSLQDNFFKKNLWYFFLQINTFLQPGKKLYREFMLQPLSLYPAISVQKEKRKKIRLGVEAANH